MDLPSDDALRSIVRAYARLRAAHGEAIGSPALVQPTGAFFPDEFRGDAPGVARLLRRIMTYAPVADDLRLELAFVAQEGERSGAGCGSGACGSGVGLRPGVGGLEEVEEIEGGYRVYVAAPVVAHADLLTAVLVRAVGAIVLSEGAGAPGVEGPAQAAEMAAVACGFGVLLANGAAVWAKSCGGLRVTSATALTVEIAAAALALFVAVHETKESEARAHLRPTQREAFDLALTWATSNPLLVEALRDRPAVLESGTFDVEPVRGLLGRWLHKRKLEREMRIAPIAAKPARSAEQVRRLEEARALVDEVLGVE